MSKPARTHRDPPPAMTPEPPLVSMAPYLSDLEVEELTGYLQPKRQARWLAENNIKAYTNARGRMRVPRDAVSARPGAGKTAVRTEPDFSRVRKAS